MNRLASKVLKRYMILWPGLFISFLLSSCTATYYSANSQNVPMLRQQGDTKIQGGVAEGNETTKFEVQGSAGITNQLGIMLNYCRYVGNDNTAGTGNLMEAGLGYYNSLQNERWIYEAYAGYGFADGYNNLSSSFSNFNLDRLFIQPNFGYTSKNFEAIVSLRGAYFKYRDVQQYYTDPDLNYPLREAGYFVLEPAFTVRGGYKYLKLQLQISHSENLTQSDFYQDNTHISAMLLIDLQRSFFK